MYARYAYANVWSSMQDMLKLDVGLLFLPRRRHHLFIYLHGRTGNPDPTSLQKRASRLRTPSLQHDASRVTCAISTSPRTKLISGARIAMAHDAPRPTTNSDRRHLTAGISLEVAGSTLRCHYVG